MTTLKKRGRKQKKGYCKDCKHCFGSKKEIYTMKCRRNPYTDSRTGEKDFWHCNAVRLVDDLFCKDFEAKK